MGLLEGCQAATALCSQTLYGGHRGTKTDVSPVVLEQDFRFECRVFQESVVVVFERSLFIVNQFYQVVAFKDGYQRVAADTDHAVALGHELFQEFCLASLGQFFGDVAACLAGNFEVAHRQGVCEDFVIIQDNGIEVVSNASNFCSYAFPAGVAAQALDCPDVAVECIDVNAVFGQALLFFLCRICYHIDFSEVGSGTAECRCIEEASLQADFCQCFKHSDGCAHDGVCAD